LVDLLGVAALAFARSSTGSCSLDCMGANHLVLGVLWRCMLVGGVARCDGHVHSIDLTRLRMVAELAGVSHGLSASRVEALGSVTHLCLPVIIS